MNVKLFVTGQFLFFFLVVSAIAIGSPINIFIDIPSLIITLGVGFALTIISFSVYEIRSAIQHVYGGEGTKDELKKSAYIWECISRNLILASAIGMIIGIVQMLQNLSDPATIGPSIAVALLTVFYGFFFCALFPVPAMFLLKKRIDTE